MSRIVRVLLLLSVMMAPGCWDNIDISDRALVLGLGIELAEDDRFLLCLQIPAPEGADGAGAPGEAPGFIHLCGTGTTLASGLASLQRRLPREIFLGQLRSIVLGSWLAERPDLMEQVIDDLLRDPLIDRKAILGVARGRAHDVLMVSPLLEDVSAVFIAEWLDRLRFNVNYPRTELWQFFRAAQAPGWDPIALAVRAGENQLELDGLAVFRDYELVGWLGPYEARGLQWLFGHGVGTTVSVRTDDGPGDVVITGVRLTTRLSPQDLAIEYRIRVSGDLAVLPRRMATLGDEDFRDLEGLLAGAIRREALAAVDRSRLLSADIAGIGRQFFYRRAKLWDQLQWPADFERTDVKVVVTATIRGRGALN